jgi:cellobiose-specific phosphotransferase system component IIA
VLFSGLVFKKNKIFKSRGGVTPHAPLPPISYAPVFCADSRYTICLKSNEDYSLRKPSNISQKWHKLSIKNSSESKNALSDIDFHVQNSLIRKSTLNYVFGKKMLIVHCDDFLCSRMLFENRYMYILFVKKKIAALLFFPPPLYTDSQHIISLEVQ